MTPSRRTFFVVALFSVLILLSLIMLSDALQNSERFSHIYSALLIFELVGLLVFFWLIGINIHRLWVELKSNQPGARLKRRMLVLFLAIAFPPLLAVYAFSMNFLKHGVDSWFDVAIETALNDSLELSRAALDLRLRELLTQTTQLAASIEAPEIEELEGLSRIDLNALTLPDNTVVVSGVEAKPPDLDKLRGISAADELTLFTDKGVLLASTEITPVLLPEAVLLQLRQHENYIGLEPLPDDQLAIRSAVNVLDTAGTGERRVLQAIYPVSERMTQLADRVQDAAGKYKELAYLREQLKRSLMMTLTLVLLYSLLGAGWVAFYSAERLATPVRDLALGTRAVAAGNFDTQLPVSSRDELGVLVESFNTMTERLRAADQEARTSRAEVEAQRTYLETVLGNLTSGVITLGADGTMRTVNPAARALLELPAHLPASGSAQSLVEIAAEHPHLQPLAEVLQIQYEYKLAWQTEVTLYGSGGRKIIQCRGARLSGDPQHTGSVVVLDDVTALIQGQRDAAWSEVARRLAHEIKNPLTPIQLAAERLYHKYVKILAAEETDTLKRMTNTIIQQVHAMKEMVNTFSDYARTAHVPQEDLDINNLLEEVLDLYRGDDAQVRITADLSARLPHLQGDNTRLRQVFTNLVKNAIEAQSDKPPAAVNVQVQCLQEDHVEFIEVRVMDRGSGIPPAQLGRIFEPYVTSKTKGTGLGLPIVKKIIEEHSGQVWMENRTDGGACAVVRLPLNHARLPRTLPQNKNAA